MPDDMRILPGFIRVGIQKVEASAFVRRVVQEAAREHPDDAAATIAAIDRIRRVRPDEYRSFVEAILDSVMEEAVIHARANQKPKE